jgi:hypothetical protein
VLTIVWNRRSGYRGLRTRGSTSSASSSAGDEYTGPVCRAHHRELHGYGDEASWWAGVNVYPVPIALALWRRSRPGRTQESVEGQPEGSSRRLMDWRPNQPASKKRLMFCQNGGVPVGMAKAKLDKRGLLLASGKPDAVVCGGLTLAAFIDRRC